MPLVVFTVPLTVMAAAFKVVALVAVALPLMDMLASEFRLTSLVAAILPSTVIPTAVNTTSFALIEPVLATLIAASWFVNVIVPLACSELATTISFLLLELSALLITCKLPWIASAVFIAKSCALFLLVLEIVTEPPACSIFTCSSWLAVLLRSVIPFAEVFNTGVTSTKSSFSLIVVSDVKLVVLAVIVPLFKCTLLPSKVTTPASEFSEVAVREPPSTTTALLSACNVIF